METYSKHPFHWFAFLPCLLSWCFLRSSHKYIVCIQILILESPSQNPNLRKDLLNKNHYSHHVLITRHCDKHLESVISLIFTTSLGGRFCLQIGSQGSESEGMCWRSPRLVTGTDKIEACFCLLSWALNTCHPKRIWIIAWDQGCEDSSQKLNCICPHWVSKMDWLCPQSSFQGC